jgi:hypothetical protein
MGKNLNNVGCAIITCDRLDFFKKSHQSLLACKDLGINIVVVNDGNEKLPNDIENVIETGGKKGVAIAKNLGLKFFLDKNLEHIFLMEDDIEILNNKIFELYINAQESTGIKHFNFGLHGNHNLDYLGRPNIRKTINYPNNTKINLYPNLLGAFSYYHVDTLREAGLMDESFYNALEHVDHTYQIIKKGYSPPFRWFADVEGSSAHLKDIVPDHQQSKIRNESDFQQTFKKALDTFISKNGFSVVQGYGPPEKLYSEKDCLENLKEIWKFYQTKK